VSGRRGGAHPRVRLLAGASFIPLEQAGESDVWGGNIDTRLYPNGLRLLTALSALPGVKQARAEVLVRVQNELRYFFGDLHGHSCYSDGALLPEVAHAYAGRVQARLLRAQGSLGVDQRRGVGDMREHAWKFNDDGRFVSFRGWSGPRRSGTRTCSTRRHPSGRQIRPGCSPPPTSPSRSGCSTTGRRHGGLRRDDVLEDGDAAMQLIEVRQDKERQGSSGP